MNTIRTIFIAIALSLSLSQAALAEEMTVDINTASAEQLAEALDGVGPAKAEAIVDYRDANGEFEHIDELVNVRGIGLRTLESNRERIEVSGEADAQ